MQNINMKTIPTEAILTRTIPTRAIPLRKNKSKIRRTMKKIQTILILIGVILLIKQSFTVINNYKVSNSKNMEITENLENTQLIPDKYEKIVITITEGDRAWNIQSKLTPNEDINETLHYVELVNGKSVENIIPGEEIIFLGLANK